MSFQSKRLSQAKANLAHVISIREAEVRRDVASQYPNIEKVIEKEGDPLSKSPLPFEVQEAQQEAEMIFHVAEHVHQNDGSITTTSELQRRTLSLLKTNEQVLFKKALKPGLRDQELQSILQSRNLFLFALQAAKHSMNDTDWENLGQAVLLLPIESAIDRA